MDATFRLALLAQFEYRFNLIIDALIQPSVAAIVEIAMWYAIFNSIGQPTLAGFGELDYLVYALWAVFFARIGANWMYEFRMVDEIESGKVNSILMRPMSFYEYYLGQFLGYKSLTCIVSFSIPLLISLNLDRSFHLSRLPWAMMMLLAFVILMHTLSFLVASLAFFFNRVHSITIAKNITLTVLSGELFPLDLMPAPYNQWIYWSPFSAGVFMPVGYLTGRMDFAVFCQGFMSIALACAVFGLLGSILWHQGRRVYSGTGA